MADNQQEATGARITSLLSIVILGIFAGILLWMLLPRGNTINLSRFMNPTYRWIIYGALLILLFFIFLEVRNIVRPRFVSVKSNRRRILTIVTLTVPSLFFLTAKDTYLTADFGNLEDAQSGLAVVSGEAATQSIIEGDPLAANANPFTGEDAERESSDTFGRRDSREIESRSETPTDENAPSDVTILTLFDQRSEYLGKTVEVIGLAESIPELGDDKFYLYRFTVWCCAADARPLGLIVLWDDIDSVRTNTWYRVKGEVAMVNVESEGEKEFLGLHADFIGPTEEPEMPFIF